jgi:apolipoprotein N-acyltransferase
VSNLPEIKRRLEKLTKLGDRMREQFKRLAGPEGEEAKKKAKESGKRIGIGAGLSFFGLVLASIAGVYVLAVIILVVNIALDRLWLSALIVVGGFLLIGGGIIAAGVSIAGPAAKNLSKAAEDVTNEMKQAGAEMKTEVKELQVIVKQEAEVRQKQIAEQAKVVAPAVAAGFLAYKVARRKMKSRREKRAILKVIEMYEASHSREED